MIDFLSCLETAFLNGQAALSHNLIGKATTCSLEPKSMICLPSLRTICRKQDALMSVLVPELHAGDVAVFDNLSSNLASSEEAPI
jgi:hypothetical protein